LTTRKDLGAQDYVRELEILKDAKNGLWKKIREDLLAHESAGTMLSKDKLYSGLAAYHLKNYEDVIKIYETALIEDKFLKTLSLDELASLFSSYSDSLYKLDKVDKFESVSRAILKDTQKFTEQSVNIKNLHERLGYLYLEVLVGKAAKASANDREQRAQQFLKDYANSEYVNRVTYLLAKALLDGDKTDEGKKILNQLMNDEKVPEYIKELCKSELSTLKLDEKIL
jgi:hypothetical protein